MNRAGLAKQAMLYDELAKAAKDKAAGFRSQLDEQARYELATQGTAPTWRLPDVGTIVLPVSSEQIYINDQAKFLEWVQANCPTQITQVPTVSERFIGNLMKDLIAADGEVVVADTGEVIPGMAVRAGGIPGALTIRPSADARAIVRQHAEGLLERFEATLAGEE